MPSQEKSETDSKHSPYRILIIGAVLTTLGSIITGLILNWVSNDPEPKTASERSADASDESKRKKTPATATPMLDPAHQATFVAELGGDLTVDSAIDINGERFVYGASGHCDIGCGLEYDDFIEFNLGRDYKKFRATLGLSDRSPQGGTRHIRVLADGALLYERDFALGQSEAVELDVNGALRLRVEVLGSHFSFGAIGDPSVE